MFVPTSQEILSYFTNTLGLYLFPIPSVNSNGTCTCGKECSSPGKHPFSNFRWRNKATNNLDDLMTMATEKGRGQEVNYAFATGLKSQKTGKHLVVVDVDEKDHEILRKLPKTFFCKTGSGGYHYWFWSTVEIRNSASKVAQKVDIRGTGGYIIIPPSKHKSGNHYELGTNLDHEILDLPQEILDLLTKKPPSKTSNNNKKKTNSVVSVSSSSSKLNDATVNWWSKSPIPDLRSAIQAGVCIPNGVRNSTVHRLLSSDRAKGVATYEDMMARAAFYKSKFEEPETFDAKELRNVVVSVMRYPLKNTLAENVNLNYSKWLTKNGIPNDLQHIEAVDKEFFSSLRPSKKPVPLAAVANFRKSWYASRGLEHQANYKPQLLAQKLRQMGFERTRTSGGNYWNVELNVLSLAEPEEVCDSTNIGEEHMATRKNKNSKKTVEEVVETPAPEAVAAAPAEAVESAPAVETATEGGEAETPQATGPIGPDGNPLTLVETREEIIKADRKYHPDDQKYTGQLSNQELMMAQIKLFETLTPEQEDAYSNGTLLVDEERTRDFMGALEKNDIVGIRTQMYRITGVEDEQVLGVPRTWNKYNRKFEFEGEETPISIYDLDLALSMGYGQILYRNDKPFGLDKDMTYKIIVKVYADSVGRTYVFKSGKQVVNENATSEENKG